MNNISKAIIAIIILILLWGGTLYFRRGPIEQDLTANVKAALSRPEFSRVAVSFNGREGTLSGSVDSQNLRKEAEQLAHQYWGVRTIDNHRFSIRKKLGLNNRKASLATHLLSLK